MRKGRFLVHLLLAGAFCGFVACKPSMPSGILDRDDMEDLLYDYNVALELARQQGGDVDAYTRPVLEKYHLTDEEFDSTLVWYTRHAYELRDVYNNVEERLRKESEALGLSQSESSIYSNLSAEGDTANIWRRSAFVVLSQEPLSNKLSFSIDADSTFRRGDVFSLNFQPVFRYQTGNRTAVCALTIHYDKDSTLTSTRTFRNYDDKISLRLEGDSTLGIKKVTGFVYLVPDAQKTPKLLLLNMLNLVRFHLPGIADNGNIEVRKDTAAVDTLQTDTLANDSARATSTPEKRLSPTEIRDKQPVEHRLEITKEKKYVPQRRQQRRSGTVRNRR